MSDEQDVPRRWRSLDEEQRAVAAELVRRALELRDLSEDGLSVREAIELAAGALERRGLAARSRGEPAPVAGEAAPIADPTSP